MSTTDHYYTFAKHMARLAAQEEREERMRDRMSLGIRPMLRNARRLSESRRRARIVRWEGTLRQRRHDEWLSS
jgi:hypothetical protein